MNSLRKKSSVGVAKHLYTFTKNNIVIVGNKSLRNRIGFLESNYNIKLYFATFETLGLFVNDCTVALVVDEIKLKKLTRNALEKFVLDTKNISRFFLSRKKHSKQFYSMLYEIGFEGALRWPADSEILVDLIIKTLKIGKSSLDQSNADKNLSISVKGHLKLLNIKGNIQVNSNQGYVYLSGVVADLFTREQAIEHSKTVLGVKNVSSDKLKVKKIFIDKTNIKKNFNLFLINTFGRKGDLSIKISGSIITLKGKVPKGFNIQNVVRFLKQQKGISKIIVNQHFNKSNKRREIELRIEKYIGTLFESIRSVKVVAYSNIIELYGICLSHSQKMSLESFVQNLEPNMKVLNKLSVKGN